MRSAANCFSSIAARVSFVAVASVAMISTGAHAQNQSSSRTATTFFSVSLIDDPLFREISNDHSIDELRDVCSRSFGSLADATNPPTSMDQHCEDSLTRSFSDEPIWTSSRSEYFTSFRGTRILLPNLDRRSIYLPYGYSDYAVANAPAWRDIFDSQVERRKSLVKETLQDEVCTMVGEGDRIQPDMAERCHANELFKYAAYMDACATGMQRVMLLRSPVDRADPQSATRYEESIDILRKNLPDTDRRQQIIDLQSTIQLHAAWVVRICSLTPEMLIDPDISVDETKPLSLEEAKEILRDTYDKILRIAAKSGDLWAILSYYPYRERDGYWRDLYRLQPHLVHRYLAVGYGPGRRLSDREQLTHGVRSYDMLKALRPDLEIDLHKYLRKLRLSVISEEEALYREGGFTNADVEAAMQLVHVEAWVLPWAQ